MMATRVVPEVEYPDSDGRPVGETPVHRDNLFDLIAMLRAWYEHDPQAYVSGNMFMYYVEGDGRKHVSPDVFVARGVPKKPERRRYLVWQEGKGPDVVIELTSASTRAEDLEDKFGLYRDTLKVPEYFLFDPEAEYLDPPLQGYRLSQGQYVPIQAVEGRLPSEVLGLHLEGEDWRLRLYNPAERKWLPTPQEAAAQAEAARQREAAARQREAAARRREAAARRREAAARQQAEAALQQAETDRQHEAAARQRAEAEVERLRQELEALRGNLPKPP
jgi:Uma2 family endonuclease